MKQFSLMIRWKQGVAGFDSIEVKGGRLKGHILRHPKNPSEVFRGVKHISRALEIVRKRRIENLVEVKYCDGDGDIINLLKKVA